MGEASWTLGGEGGGGGGGGRLSVPGDGSSASTMRRFSGLHTLASLILSLNKLYGSIPPALAHNAVQLVCFRGAVNLLSGTLPEALRGMTLLGEFAITENGVAGAIPQAFCCLQRLDSLRLGHNHLSETIHKLICCLPSSLRRMQLQRNPLSGYLPSCLGSLSALKDVWVGENNIRGSIPDNLRYMTELENFNASFNRIRGTLPAGVASLREFDVSGNAITGAIPAAWHKQLSLVQFSCRKNLLEGTMPSSFPNIGMAGLLDFEVSGTGVVDGSSGLRGALPDALGRASSLWIP